CGYHTRIGVFICYECRLVPECLLTHLQQKHGYDGKSIDNTILPESAVTVGADPNGNQHTNNPHLASAIRNPDQWWNSDIVQGWLCTAPNCRYCGYTVQHKTKHKIKIHQGDQLVIVPALVLRLPFSKAQTSCFLITRLDTTNSCVNLN